MENEYKLMIRLKGAKRVALTFFGIGTLLFAIELLLGDLGTLVFPGLVFIAIAIVVNAIMVLLAFIDLIIKDRLESFFAICILLANIPIAILYAYLLLKYSL